MDRVLISSARCCGAPAHGSILRTGGILRAAYDRRQQDLDHVVADWNQHGAAVAAASLIRARHHQAPLLELGIADVHAPHLRKPCAAGDKADHEPVEVTLAFLLGVDFVRRTKQTADL
ncbi:hypothetical protein [Bradyrhizobium sp. SZCCHNR1082]|uniref:hypothetical protein n=1 Tax=Bradyrhizobium sp. SZCCHNR1082 TaxID=3057363 RepID=UPI0029169567|nr:hypothetical protein [Bradyrhizobium sp. SZCCHNR1082]